jgi:hypothetical protein
MELLQTEAVVKQIELLGRTVQGESEEKQKKTEARPPLSQQFHKSDAGALRQQ